MRHRSATALAALLLTGAAACSGGSGTTAGADPLLSYTDPGDGCPQVVSAIAYADNTLKPLGQEAYQDFTDEVRSNLAAVDGTQTLEVQDFPSKAVLRQARKTGALATAASRAGVSRTMRIRRLREYRREAAQLVLMCATYVDPNPTDTATRSAAG